MERNQPISAYIDNETMEEIILLFSCLQQPSDDQNCYQLYGCGAHLGNFRRVRQPWPLIAHLANEHCFVCNPDLLEHFHWFEVVSTELCAIYDAMELYAQLVLDKLKARVTPEEWNLLMAKYNATEATSPAPRNEEPLPIAGTDSR